MSYTYSFDQEPLNKLSAFDSPETMFDSEENMFEPEYDFDLLFDESTLVCAFCETIYEQNTKVCYVCEDYKGLMTIAEFEHTYGER